MNVPSTIAREQVRVQAAETIGRHSKSFALASKLLPEESRVDAQVLYAYCRHADDAIDEVPSSEQPDQLARLRRELDMVYGGVAISDPLLSGFQAVARARGIPRAYLDELIAGMEMDVEGTRYATFEQLLRYCYRVAGTVGLMMCHVMGVRTPGALTHAAHLGIAMQLTNIARDVLEDWERGRLYLPRDLLTAHGVGDLSDHLGGPFPEAARAPVAAVLAELLARADGYYASGDAGLSHLSSRCEFGVRTARLVYAEIGAVLARKGYDPCGGRSVVSTGRKLWLALRAGLRTLSSLPLSLLRPRPTLPVSHIEDPQRVLLLPGT